jgi:hypothetical protein
METTPEPTAVPEAVPATAKRGRRTRRRIAKALLYVALILTAVTVLAEPWLLVPIVIASVAVSLWD